MALSKFATRFNVIRVAKDQAETKEVFTVEDLDTIYDALNHYRAFINENEDIDRRISDIQAALHRLGT